MLNFIICDDNAYVRQSTQKFLESIFIKNNIDATVVLSTESDEEVINFIKYNTVDVILLDVMFGTKKLGLEIATRIREINKSMYIIFVSGYMDFVFQSLQNKIFDYLLKPTTYEKLESCIVRLVLDMTTEVVYIHFNEKVIINRDDIFYIEKIKMKANIYLERRVISIYQSLDKIETILSSNFMRCHKSYIANVSKIENIDYISNSICFKNSFSCPFGPSYRGKLKEVFKYVGYDVTSV